MQGSGHLTNGQHRALEWLFSSPQTFGYGCWFSPLYAMIKKIDHNAKQQLLLFLYSHLTDLQKRLCEEGSKKCNLDLLFDVLQYLSCKMSQGQTWASLRPSWSRNGNWFSLQTFLLACLLLLCGYSSFKLACAAVTLCCTLQRWKNTISATECL